MKKALEIDISGLEQEVSFRPFVYELAKKHHLNGWVKSHHEVVEIKIAGKQVEIDLFVDELKNHSHKIAKAHSFKYKEGEFKEYQGFEIIPSKTLSDELIEINVDLAVCDDCLHDIKTQANQKGYSFAACKNCGPHFSIVKNLPYDRSNTTMAEFDLCENCQKVFSDENGRHFHSPSLACNDCGPQISLICNGKTTIGEEKILQKAAQLIDEGKTVVIKGIGGFFIACNALDQAAVERLRINKKGYGKPLAVMFKDINAINKYADISEAEENTLTSIQKPIVLVKHKKRIFHGVNDGLNTLGVMLPHMPLHYLLFEKLKTDALAISSGNISEEPIVKDDQVALKKLGTRCDAMITNNREIHNRVDDSIVFSANNKLRLVKRARGFAPKPISVSLNCQGIFATGTDVENVFALGKGDSAILSQYIGNLRHSHTYEFYEENFERFCQLFDFNPTLVACDLHPDFLTTRFAEKFDVPIIKVQHHHAHMASCLTENHHFGETIGVCLDGAGYGTDGNLWGGVFLTGDICDFERTYHFEYVPISGGNMSAYHPWRSALSYLYFHGIDRKSILKFLPGIEKNELIIALNSLERNINCPLCSSSGRLFDAVAALTGLCLEAKYHSQAPMMLESKLLKNCDEFYQFEIFDGKISFENTITDILDDIHWGVDIRHISTKFHNTIADVIVRVSQIMREEKQINEVALSGGAFQNKYLLEKAISILEVKGFNVLTQSKVPSNDGGIALGQLAVAAAKHNQLCV